MTEVNSGKVRGGHIAVLGDSPETTGFHTPDMQDGLRVGVRILVADDHEVVRHGVRALLETQPGWEVVGEAATGREAIEKARKSQPDVVVMDISMPELNGLEATRQILKVAPLAQVLVLTIHESEQVAREVLAAGARGYLMKSDAGHDLVAAVISLRQHKPFFTSKVAEIVLEGYLQAPERDLSDSLTPREREILQLLAEGKSNKDVANALGISIKTAETHRANIMHKLNFHSVTELIHYAIRNKIICLSGPGKHACESGKAVA